MQKSLSALTYKIKTGLAARYDLVHLKRWAFMIALLSCLSLGSIMLFSLFLLALHHAVGLTYTQINLIVSFSAVGMYLCLPVLGYLADCYGPALLSIISIWAFCPAYFVNAAVVRALENSPSAAADLSRGSVFAMAASFCFIGLATSSLYFSSLLTCAKIYPDHKGLAISLPVSCYGVLSLLGSQILKLDYFHASRDILDLYKVFMFFSVLYFFVGILNLVSNLIVSIEQDVIFNDSEPLLSAMELGPEPALTPQCSAVEPPHHRERYASFLRDKSAWILLVALFFSIGPLECFQNNLGLIIEATAGPSVQLSDQVLVIAALSTAIRLFVGVMIDWVSSEKRRYPVCKVWFLLALMAVGIAGQIMPIFSSRFSVIALLNGICYGGLFTAFPTVVASIWGVDLMGSTWGSFMVAPAFGSITFSLLHGYSMDLCASDSGALGCLDRYFKLTASCFCIGMVLIAVVWRGFWWRRGMKCF
ncbi:MFS general substrate transporter [Metschnikowia bicuspidata var. bicuspidata NRRL YB-4993]|uniref:Probable transporter MCH1 n=1 Tax=Metschnikowia bicuspidata var. bicuspidata NRRL YB-4993 TaxID=869754 RepID=A0A1A0HC83_9ASCO|nr:MFS general substrate transporter [Metschnikowia bicuspidata var. bicuspidata NRRL YB-4993]OBA21482.1 MFS general substrate transporter [Metschnikowia bicuspidata var. bicuspidata NRRL YB-4993]